ncbi:MAG: hypothetical protein ACKVZ0_22340 [Gemmatimonadales bacterium]
MTTQKDFKRLVRQRMQKTGEAYTAARAVLLQTPPKPVDSLPPPPDYAKLAGMSDEAIKAKTGCGWEMWVFVLDKVGAHEWTHRAIADYVHTKYKVGNWWTQSVTVGYERIKGLRAIGQRRSGSFEGSRSRTFAVPVDRLYKMFADGRSRARWLRGVKLVVRTATPNRSMRITWPDTTSVELWFVAKGPAKSTVSVQHAKLPDAAAAARVKKEWGERLDALGALLAG